jgi:hypothetical protein
MAYDVITESTCPHVSSNKHHGCATMNGLANLTKCHKYVNDVLREELGLTYRGF